MIKRSWIPYIILIVSLILTISSTYYVNRATNIEDRLRFLNAVHDTSSNIETQLETYVTLLRGVAGLFAAEPNVSQGIFDSYIQRLQVTKNYPGTIGIGYIQVVNTNDKSNFIQTIQTDENPTFTITPSGERSHYYVIRYFSLVNQKAPMSIGYDLGTNQTRLEAMESAQDSGMMTTTKDQALQTGKKNNNLEDILMFTPVYQDGIIPTTVDERRKNIEGFIFSSFATNSLFIGEHESDSLPQLVNFKIYDGSQAANKNLIYDSTSVQNPLPTAYTPRFTMLVPISINGETWTISYSNHPQFDKESQMYLAPLIFLGGILVSIIFFVLSRSQYYARTNAEIAAEKLKRSQKELEKAIGLRDNFISIASHELKTPVTSLKVYTEFLLRQFRQKNDEKAVTNLSKIIKQIDKLTLLIQDLLNVSRIQSNQLTFRIEKFDANALVKEVIESTQQIADHHRIVLKGSTTKEVWGDKERITQVIINLLTNALKYSPK